MRLFKKSAAPFSPTNRTRVADHDLANGSADDLRQMIADLETVIAEHEATNAFLRDLLTQRWFDTPDEELDEARSLQHL